MNHRQGLPATCLGCGCTCDDIQIVVDSGRIVDARHACPLGAAWFGDGVVPARVRIGGQESTFEQALDATMRLLGAAERALIYLAPDITCETQREAAALADLLHASLDSVTSAGAMRSVLAAQERGRATATLGEVRNRADVLVFWGVDPAHRYPRYWTRYGPEPAGIHVPGGRRSRMVVAVDVGEVPGPLDADRRVSVPVGREVATLSALAARIARHEADGGAVPTVTPAPEVTATTATATATTATATDDSVPSDTQDPDAIPEATGDPGTDAVFGIAAGMADWLLAGRYVVIVAEAEGAPGSDPGRSGALIALAQALNGPTRGALSLLRAGGNRSGADAVMTWQTGYPAAVDFARGYPRYRPHDGTAAARLRRGEVDALLVIGSADLIPSSLLGEMAQVPHAVFGPRASDSPLAAGVAAIDTAVAGIHEAGLALRMDDIPLPVRRVLEGPPAAAPLVRALRDRSPRSRA